MRLIAMQIEEGRRQMEVRVMSKRGWRILWLFSMAGLAVLFLACVGQDAGFRFGTAWASGYPESTELVEAAARQLVEGLEKKAEYRYQARAGGDYFGSNDPARTRPYVKVPWSHGQREPVVIYLFEEKGTQARPPFAELLERQLSLALDGSSKFLPVTREGKFLKMHQSELGDIVDLRTAPAFGRVLGARYFLTGTFWLEGSRAFVLVSLWDAELGTELNAQVELSQWDLILVRQRAGHGWWKALIGIAGLLGLGLFFRVLNRSICYDLRCRENKTVYWVIQILFGIVLLGLTVLWSGEPVTDCGRRVNFLSLGVPQDPYQG